MKSDTPESEIRMVEGGFLLRPELIQSYTEMHDNFEPYAIQAPGFMETYGGLVNNTIWGVFTSKFESLDQMHRWYRDERHKEIMNMARAKYWTTYYIRKWRRPSTEEIESSELMYEFQIHRSAFLSSGENLLISDALESLRTSGAKQWERITGSFAEEPFLYAGPVKTQPVYDEAMYVIMTRWESKADLDNWRNTTEFRNLAQLGDIKDSIWVQITEKDPRLGQTPDGKQANWLHADALKK